MKRNGLRALGLASCAVVVFSLLGMAVNLDSIVKNELITEISNAAGLNLVDAYIAKYTVEELGNLAAKGFTPGIKLAADRALFKLNGGILPLITLGDDALLALATAGDQDAADAYVFTKRAANQNPRQVEASIAAATIKTVEIAFGKLLGGFYGPGSPVGQKTEAELLDLVVNSPSLGIRVGAATALTTYWILNSNLRIDQVEKAILGATLYRPELALAYQGFLAYLYSL